MSYLKEKALEQSHRSGRPPHLTCLALGASTGEELARAFFEIARSLIASGEKVKDWKQTVKEVFKVLHE